MELELQPAWGFAPAVAASELCTGGVIALTFDDGPVTATPDLLDILKREGLRATFFVVGQRVEERPDIAQRIVSDGHAIASHSYTHPDLTKLTAAEVESELQRTQRAVLDVTGVSVAFVRPPYGESNDEVSRHFSTMGLAEVMWTDDTHDWTGVSVEDILRAVGSTQPGGVVLMHDSAPHVLEALPLIAKHFRDNRICTGRLARTTERMPVGSWYPRAFYVRAEAW
jgi:endo-1,4-beta-xylanase